MRRKTELVAVLILCLLLFVGATGYALPLPAYRAPVTEDFSSLSWSAAFDQLHAKFSREYAFTKWKNIDWVGLYNKYQPKIAKAQNAQNFEAYYLALREYVNCIPDGHVRMSNIQDINDNFIGGGFGFAVTKLTNGKLIVSWVDESSPAFALGMRPGAELLEWNNRPIAVALSEKSTIFASNSATNEDLDNQKARYLTREHLDADVVVAFLNINSGKPIIAELTAYADKKKSLSYSYPNSVVSDGLRDLILEVANPAAPPTSMVETKIIDGDIGYIKIWGEIDVDFQQTGTPQSTLNLFRSALSEFNNRKISGLILDIRNNVGGSDVMVVDILASFYKEKSFYEYQNGFNTITGVMEIWPDPDRKPAEADCGLYIEPTVPFFAGTVVAIINSKCVSSGEGLAMGIKNLPNGDTLGFYGTNGSFGMAGDEAKMPGSIEVHWPYGQSLDKNKIVQIDSRNGNGGVTPSIRTPMTLENALRVANGEDVELEQAVAVVKSRIAGNIVESK
ncbi:MAG: S41 family peptidase [Bacillota bacterium]